SASRPDAAPENQGSASHHRHRRAKYAAKRGVHAPALATSSCAARRPPLPHYPLMVTFAFLASATKAAKPLSVSGWLSSFLKMSVGMVPTSAPARIDSRTWLTVRIEAARISVLKP